MISFLGRIDLSTSREALSAGGKASCTAHSGSTAREPNAAAVAHGRPTAKIILPRVGTAVRVLALLFVAPVAAACDGLRAEHGWIRLPPPNAKIAAAYFTLVNAGARKVDVLGVSSPAFGHAMLHETRYVDGHAEMRHLDHIELDPGASFEAAPGGAHVMLGEARAPIDLDSFVEVTLRCSAGAPLSVWLPVLRKAP